GDAEDRGADSVKKRLTRPALRSPLGVWRERNRMKGDRRAQMLAAALMGALAAIALAPAPAGAASRICRQLEAELAGTSRTASPAQIGKYDSAIKRQRAEIAKARGQARHLGCGFSLFSSNVDQCASLNASLSRMNGNLDKLERKRAELAR